MQMLRMKKSRKETIFFVIYWANASLVKFCEDFNTSSHFDPKDIRNVHLWLKVLRQLYFFSRYEMVLLIAEG